MAVARSTDEDAATEEVNSHGQLGELDGAHLQCQHSGAWNVGIQIQVLPNCKAVLLYASKCHLQASI